MPRAAGSRSWAAVRSWRSSRATRVNVPRPNIRLNRSRDSGARGTLGTALGPDERLLHRQRVELEDRIEQRPAHAGQELDRLERLDRADDAGGSAQHAGLAA